MGLGLVYWQIFEGRHGYERIGVGKRGIGRIENEIEVVWEMLRGSMGYRGDNLGNIIMKRNVRKN